MKLIRNYLDTKNTALISLTQFGEIQPVSIKDAEAKIAWIVPTQIKFYSGNQSRSKMVAGERKTLEAKYNR
jgi:hypothetical protein